METKELAECIKALTPEERAALNEQLLGHGLRVHADDDPLPPDPTHPKPPAPGQP